MSDDDETHLLSHLDMDEAFCARMRIAIAAGLENAPTALNQLFDGANIGKLMVKVAE